MPSEDLLIIRRLLVKHGLRPVVNAVATVTESILNDGEVVEDEYGVPMVDDDVRTFIANLKQDMH